MSWFKKKPIEYYRSPSYERPSIPGTNDTSRLDEIFKKSNRSDNMEQHIFNMLREKGIKNNIDIFEITHRGDKFTINYFDGEMDIERHKLKEKQLVVNSFTNLDEAINEIKSKKFISTKVNHVDLLKELLNNSRIDSININIQRTGNVEETHINAKLKEMI